MAGMSYTDFGFHPSKEGFKADTAAFAWKTTGGFHPSKEGFKALDGGDDDDEL